MTSPSSSARPMLTGELLQRLRRHYIKPGPWPGGVFLPEVTYERAGGRRADALYVGFTSSRGHLLIGHELKVSRSDWLHELADIEKAETWAAHCHAWYIVAPSAAIVRLEEVPPGWGLLLIDPASKTRMRVAIKAPLNPAVQPGWTAVHSMFKRLDTLAAQAQTEAVARATDKLEAENRSLRSQLSSSAGAELARVQDRADRAEALVAELAQILGLRPVEGRWADSGQVSLAQLRSSFAAWLRVDRSADAALDLRRPGLRYAREQLEAALESIARASAILDPETPTKERPHA